MTITTIADSCTLHARIGWQGLTKKEYLDTGDYYLITGVDFDHGRIAFNNCHYVTKERYDQDRHIQVNVDDILVTKDGTIGKVAIIDKPINKPATLNSGVFVVRPKDKNKLLPRYLMYVLLSKHFRDFIDRIKVGCTIAHLNQEKFLNYDFPLQSLAEQNRIIKSFDSLLSILNKRQLELQCLDNLIKARFVEMFGDQRYPQEPLDNNVYEMFIGPFGSALKNECFVEPENGYCMVYEQKHAIQKTMDVTTRYYIEREQKASTFFD